MRFGMINIFVRPRIVIKPNRESHKLLEHHVAVKLIVFIQMRCLIHRRQFKGWEIAQPMLG